MKVARIWWAFRHEQKALWHYFSVFYNYNIECQRSIETPGRCAMSCQWSIPVVRPVLFAHVEKKWRCPKVIRPNVLLVPRQIPINYRTISFKPLDHGRDWESKTRLVWYCYIRKAPPTTSVPIVDLVTRTSWQEASCSTWGWRAKTNFSRIRAVASSLRMLLVLREDIRYPRSYSNNFMVTEHMIKRFGSCTTITQLMNTIQLAVLILYIFPSPFSLSWVFKFKTGMGRICKSSKIIRPWSTW